MYYYLVYYNTGLFSLAEFDVNFMGFSCIRAITTNYMMAMERHPKTLSSCFDSPLAWLCKKRQTDKKLSCFIWYIVDYL